MDEQPTPENFRKVLGHYATGVTIVTSKSVSGDPVGLTANSFTSVSLDPPLVSFCVKKDSSSFAGIRDTGKFLVNILSESQGETAHLFATPGADRFGQTAYSVSSHSGLPVLDASIATIECSVIANHEAGDHFLVLGRVDFLSVQKENPPLLFYRSNFGTFAQS